MRFYIHYGLLALQLLAAGTILTRRLGHAHSALVAYLFFAAGMNAFLVNVDSRSDAYLRSWAFALPVQTALTVAIGIQAYGRSLETSPRARRLSHQGLLGVCAIAALLAQWAQETFTPYGVASRVDQGVSVALGLFCLVMLPLLQHIYSPRRRPNAIAQEWIVTILYLGNALTLLATHWKLFPLHIYLAAGTATTCCLAWIACLTQEGELLPPPPADHGDARSEKLAAQAQFDALATKVKSAASSK